MISVGKLLHLFLKIETMCSCKNSEDCQQQLLFIFTMQSCTMKKSVVRVNVWLTTGRGRKHSHHSIPSFPLMPRHSVRSRRWRFRSASGPMSEQNRRVMSRMHLLMSSVSHCYCCVSHPLMDVLDAHQITSLADTILQRVVPRLHVWGEEVTSLLIRPPALLTLTEALEKTMRFSYLIRNLMRTIMKKRTNERNDVFCTDWTWVITKLNSSFKANC